jgi:hypothetical protein
MTPEEIDRMLADDEKILPSSGFTVSVMELVRQEAIAPRPLAFPWGRALPGFIALLVAFAVAFWIGAGALSDPSAATAFDGQIRAIREVVARPEVQWIAVAVIMTFISTVLPLRLMRGRM